MCDFRYLASSLKNSLLTRKDGHGKDGHSPSAASVANGVASSQILFFFFKL